MTTNLAVTREQLLALPKVVLHDHLDGGLRPQTIIDLAAEIGHVLPHDTATELGAWFVAAADSGSLERYLETFEHTVAVMQTRHGLIRVAQEMVADMVADGVIYAESRWAPEQHVAGGLTMQQAVDAVQEGIAAGVAQAAADGQFIEVHQILAAMRHLDRWDEVSDLALANRERGVCGFDIAGPEVGFLPDRFAQVWQKLALANFPVTIHAGEEPGIDSISRAVHVGQASRLGHGAYLSADITGLGTENARLGPLANWVRDAQIPLEVCPCSNLQTGVAATIAEHPITALRDLDFAVTINTDNRLMSGTSMTNEMFRLVSEAGWTVADLCDVTLAAAWGAFIHHDQRHALGQRILAGFEQDSN
ncbi:adenosine deaminase [Jonesiaceae bacterium BS-20]|uniref:adenosine deaminase n=1 Tax=Jonesiaceae bacterium BS-20 TaxID=3120821 RepID=A0AAU7DYL6_9MICO